MAQLLRKIYIIWCRYQSLLCRKIIEWYVIFVVYVDIEWAHVILCIERHVKNENNTNVVVSNMWALWPYLIEMHLSNAYVRVVLMPWFLRHRQYGNSMIAMHLMDAYVFPMHNAFDAKEFTYSWTNLSILMTCATWGSQCKNTRFYAYVLWFALNVHQLLSIWNISQMVSFPYRVVFLIEILSTNLSFGSCF